ncbi:hypothetical protein GCK72_019015 [Caenorhabditis remanei]|uniref:Seven TM Receptor n=1 Tax=Caenorhabditis remanei TaxID=31234 RepID=A0A6A5GBJ8_CAERE|nr:hypothetical protein GCK72_019015 [Caenorhabditis remanei]KAF1752460.1 hypothetical protein GCK72_019015 [Caenorhabditis remanei]
MFGVSMAMFGIHFVYRFLVVSGNRYLKTLSSDKFAVWFVFPVFYGLVWAAVISVTLSPNKYTDQVLINSYLMHRSLSTTDISYLGPNYWITINNGNPILNLSYFVGMSLIFIMVTISILTMFVFATLSYRKMGTLVEVTNNSKQYRSLQLQLLNSLVAQALIPAILMQEPSCIVFSAPFFHKGTELLGGILGITVSLYPVLDPLPTMFVIKHYRNAILKCCCLSEKKDNKPTKLTEATIKI